MEVELIMTDGALYHDVVSTAIFLNCGGMDYSDLPVFSEPPLGFDLSLLDDLSPEDFSSDFSLAFFSFSAPRLYESLR